MSMYKRNDSVLLSDEPITLSDEMREGFEKAFGEIRYSFRNDFIFRATLQKNKSILKGLISSLLGISEESILSLELQNPIDLGRAVNDKDFILDIKMILNNSVVIDLEMQVVNYHNWPERSLVYLCRCYDNLKSGEDYKDTKGAVNIGIVDFDLFPEYPELYSNYVLTNVNEQYRNVYTDKFRISVLNLKHIDKATEKDKKDGIEYWARLFAARTWEDVKMLAMENKTMKEAAESLYVYNEDQMAREYARAREDAIHREYTMAMRMEELTTATEELTQQKEKLTQQKEKLTQQTVKLTNELDKLEKENQSLKDMASKIQRIVKNYFSGNMTVEEIARDENMSIEEIKELLK